MINIYFRDDSELVEFEATSKGYRVDVYVKVEEDLFNLRVFSFIRLKQEYESEIKDNGFYSVEPNLVIVNNASKEEILYTIEKLYKQKYFDEIKPVKNVDVNQLKKIS